MMLSIPKVLLVGAGPGDPGLLTLRAARALKEAEVVLYDRLVSAEVLAMANPEAEFLYAGKNDGEQERMQEWINAEMLSQALAGKRVVRLKGGDALIFGRGGEEWRFLAEHGVEVEEIPGLSSALAVPGGAGIPLTFRGLSRGFAVITGHCEQGATADWRRYAAVDTLVILMGVRRRAEIAAAMIEAGREANEPVAFIERGSTDRERVVIATLGEVAGGGVDVESPAVFVVGEVVRLRPSLLPECAAAAICK